MVTAKPVVCIYAFGGYVLQITETNILKVPQVGAECKIGEQDYTVESIREFTNLDKIAKLLMARRAALSDPTKIDADDLRAMMSKDAETCIGTFEFISLKR